MPGHAHGGLHVDARSSEPGVVGAPERVEVERQVVLRARLDEAERPTLGIGGCLVAVESTHFAEAGQRANDARLPERLSQPLRVRDLPLLALPGAAPLPNRKDRARARAAARMPPGLEQGQ